MSFKKFANPANNAENLTQKEISVSDFTMFLETCDTLGDFYMGRVLSSLYWSSVIGVYNAIKNSYGSHSESYIKTMERQKASNLDIVYWLHAEGYKPSLESGNSIPEILDFVMEEFNIETETALVIYDHIRELKRHNHLMTAQMDKKRAVMEFAQLPEKVRLEYQAMITNNLKNNIDDQASARAEAIAEMDSPVNRDVNHLSPSRLYSLLSKLDEKMSVWIKDEESKKYIAGVKNDTYMIGLTSTTLVLLDGVQDILGKLIKEADELDKTNALPEPSDAIDALRNGINDMPDSSGVDDYNGGINIE